MGRTERYIILFLIMLVLIFLYLLPPDLIDWEICLFKKFLHFRCPLCGMTHSVYYTSRGDLTQAFNYHPFGILFFFMLIGSIPFLLSDFLFNSLTSLIRNNRHLSGILLIFFTFLFLLYSVIREL